MSTAAIPVHVALVDSTKKIKPVELAKVAGALNEQIQADVAPVWKLAATVGAYPKAPKGTWRLEVVEGTGVEEAAGYHADEHGQPFSKIGLEDGKWTVTASHELIEMLIDPFGSRLHSAAHLKGWKGSKGATARVRYLMEPGDPCEEVEYPVGGVQVSDFVLPSFYRSSGGAAGYSHTGAVKKPLEILDGGYISFEDPADGSFWQRFNINGELRDRQLPQENARISHLREFCDEQARRYKASLEK
jgi:hypothetical protein